MPIERKSVEPMAAATGPAQVAAKLVAGCSTTIEEDADNELNLILSNISWRHMVELLADRLAELPQ